MMMYKHIALRTIIIAVVLFALGGLYALPGNPHICYAEEDNNLSEEIQYGNLFYYQLRDSGLHITRAVKDQHYDEDGNLVEEDKCLITELEIPDELVVDGTAYPVTYIDGKIGSIEGVFSGCINLRSVKLPVYLKSLGDQAFSGCELITEIELPQSLEVLGCGAFQNCVNLMRINIPSKVSCGEYAGEVAYPGPFDGASSLNDVSFEAGIERIDNAMFKNSGITSIEIPDSVKTIGSNAFMNTTNLNTVEISENSTLESIGWSGFQGSGITSIYLPDSLTMADVAAFADCTNLESVRIPKNLGVNVYQLEHGYNTGIFNGCTSLQNISFADGITKIGFCWFFDSPIESITIPASVTEIGDSAFRYAKQLREVSYEDPDNLQVIGPSAFKNDTGLQEFEFTQNLTTIDSFAFQNSGLVEADLPSSLTTMNEGAFSWCSDLVSVKIPAAMSFYGGATLGGGGTGAFEGSNALKDVSFEKGVTHIDDGLFGWNDGLEEIELPEGVVSIGYRAFRRDSNLKKVTLPQSLNIIEPQAFSDCTNLGTLIFKGDRPSVEESICDNVTANVEFDVWDMIPDNWGGNLTFMGKDVKYVTEDMLFEEYNRFLKNDTYNNMSGALFESLFAGMSERSGFADAISALKQTFNSGFIGTHWYLFKTNITNWTEQDMQKELAAELVYSLANDASIDDYIDDAKKWNSCLEKANKLLSKADKDFTAKDMKLVADIFGRTEKDKRQLLDLMKKLKAENVNNKSFEKAQKMFKESGRVLTVADAVISAYIIYSADRDIVNKLYDLIGNDSDLGSGLALIKKEQEKGFTLSVLNHTLEEITDSELPGLVKDLLVEEIVSKLISGAEGAVTIGELIYKGISLLIPGEMASDVNVAWMYIQNSTILQGKCRSYRMKIAKNWNDGGSIPTSELKSDYSLLMEAYYHSLVNSKEPVKKCSSKKNRDRIEKSFKKYIGKVTYEKYLKSCLKNANTYYKTTMLANGTVTINYIGTRTQKSAVKNTKVASPNSLAAVDDESLTYIDIPEEIDGQKVSGIEDEVLSNRQDITIVTLPNSIESIGNSTFHGCSALEKVFMQEGVKTIGHEAFSLCASLEDLDLPDSVEQLENDAFEGDSELVLTGASDFANGFAASNNIPFESREKSIREVSVISAPSKLSYKMDEAIDSSGLVLGVTYTDGSTGTVEEGFGCSFDGERQIGENTIIVMYKDFVTEFTVDVTEDDCSYTVYYVDEDGKELEDSTTGSASGGSTVSLDAIEIDGYEPENNTQDVTIGVLNDFRFIYKKVPGIDIEGATVECINEAEYTGKSIQPEVKVTIDNENLELNKDYSVRYGENISGEGIVQICGIGQYEGEMYVVFTINKSEDTKPVHKHVWKHYKKDAGLLKDGTEYDYCSGCKNKKNVKTLKGYANYYVRGLKVKKAKKAFTVKWKKQSKRNQKEFNGYQIRYSTNANMNDAKYVTAGKATKKKTIKKLSKKKYYVQVRTYTMKGKKTYYSKWSPTKSVKTG